VEFNLWDIDKILMIQLYFNAVATITLVPKIGAATSKTQPPFDENGV